jgi:hypothetical protein
MRKTRSQAKEEQEGTKRWFDDKVDPGAVLKTWLEVIVTNDDTGHIQE